MEQTLAQQSGDHPPPGRSCSTPASTPTARSDARPQARRDRCVEIEHALDAVTNLDEDRILRRFLNLIAATLRTNFFQTAADGRPEGLPLVQARLAARSTSCRCRGRCVEIFVYSPRVEAIHLRGGKVARGGIRWSDRREDFRTEVLGLMKAQMVKNAVIVPVGSKGGFVVKRPPPAAAARRCMAEGIACYKTLMRGLLDITDNLTAAGVGAAASDVVRHDDDDPYLVVAADKGTATFSDIANGVAARLRLLARRRLRLGRLGRLRPQGDGHHRARRLGIGQAPFPRARQRHPDARTSPCVGVGDMSGDVFGNGMLLSPHIRLLAAFNHLHIFLDPDPDRGGELRRAPAAVRPAALVLGRLRPRADLQGRRHLRAQAPSRSRCRPRSRARFGIAGRAADARPS